MDYVLMVLMAFASSVKALIQGVFGRKHMKNSQDALMYNCLMFAATAGIFLIYMLLFTSEGFPSLTTILLAGCMGLSSTIFQTFYTKAMGRGSVSLTMMINNFYLLFPIVASNLMYNERVAPVQIAGIVLLAVSMLLTATPERGKKNDIVWLLLAVTCMACSGFVAIIQKVHQRSAFAAESTGFVVTSNLTALIFSSAVYQFRKLKGGEQRTVRLTLDVVLPILLVGLILGGYHMLALYLNRVTNSVIMYPVINVTNLMFGALWGAVIFKDKLSLRKGLALAVGAASIALINLTL